MTVDGSLGGPARVAYLISSYQEGGSLLRLVDALRSGGDVDVVVYHNVFARPLDPAKAQALAERGVHVHPASEPVGWGDMSLEAARWRELRWMTEHLEFDWVVLLSEQDYPIRPPEEFAAHVATCGADALLEAAPIDELDPDLAREMRRRYLYVYEQAPRWLQLVPGGSEAAERARGLQRTATGLFNRLSRSRQLYHLSVRGRPSLLGRRAEPGPFGPDLRCWYGSAWFPMSARAVRSLLASIDARPDVVAHYRRAVIPTESATITLLANDPGLVVRRESSHVIRWTRPTSGRPDVLTRADLPGLLASGRFFARKVDGRAHGDLLDALDAHFVAQRAATGVVR